MKYKFYQCVQNENKETTPDETIKTIKEAKFDGVFVQWYDEDWLFSQQQQVDLCKKLGLEILFAHLGYQEIDKIWIEGEEGDKVVKNYIKNLDDCKSNGINLVCMHVIGKNFEQEPNELGVTRLQKIIDYAKKLEIKVSIENTKSLKYLDYIFDRIKNENMGICYDAGHCHLFFDDEFDWEKYKNKIFALHLHDNDKSGDLHLLPFEGTIDWEKLVKNLKRANYDGPIILESCYRRKYLEIPLLDFYNLSYEKAKKIYNLSNK